MDEPDLETRAAAALRRIAWNEEIRAYVTQNPPLRDALFRAASRFVCGEALPDCLAAAKTLNERGHAATIDHMGESTRDEGMANEVTTEFLQVIRAVSDGNLDCSVSLDLSHVGLALDPNLAFRNTSRIAAAAKEAGIEVMISMEGTERTDGVLETHRRLCETFDNVGVTLQAYLYRTDEDLAAALERPGRVRLVKGAYEEPGTLARPRESADVDDAYREYLEALLGSGHRCSVATHDPALLEHAHRFVRENWLDAGPAECEMLYGVTPELLGAMRDLGHRTRTYLVYGEEWYLYLCHRLAEHPPNIYRAITDAVG